MFHQFFRAFSETRSKLERRRAQEAREARMREAQKAGGGKKRANFIVVKKSAAPTKAAADAIAESNAASAEIKT